LAAHACTATGSPDDLGAGHAPQIYARVLGVIISSRLPSSILHHLINNIGTQQAGTISSRKHLSISEQPVFGLSNMSEKTPLIPLAAPSGNVPRVQGKCKGRAIGRLLAATAAAGLIYYGMPYGTLRNSRTVFKNSLN
jgi:hypothetical protein